MTLVARPDFPATDLAGFMAEIKQQGDKLNLAHSGLGAANHLCGMLLQQRRRHGDDGGGVPRQRARDHRADGRAHRRVLRPGDQHRCPSCATGASRATPSPSRSASPASTLPTTTEAGQPSLRHEHLARPLRAEGHAGSGAGAPLRRDPRGAAGGARCAQRFAELVTAPADGGTRHAGLPPPLPGRGGRPLAADHPGGGPVRGLTTPAEGWPRRPGWAALAPEP